MDRENALLLRVVNTGKSDAMILRFPDGRIYLIDTGLKNTSRALIAAIEKLGAKKLDGVILTHGHKDHIGGLKDVRKGYVIDAIYTARADNETISDKEYGNIKSYCLEHIQLQKGDTFMLADATVAVLSPDRAYSEKEDDNNNSLVLKLTYGEKTFLFMGDATKTIENLLLNESADVKADVIKLGHHGEKDASGEKFIMAVAPKLAVITGSSAEDPESVSDEVTGMLKSLGIPFITNDGGHFVTDIWCDGKNIEIETIQNYSD